MGKMKIPAGPKVSVTRYTNLKGADFSRDPSEVDGSRSPMPLNMISDRGGGPVKRPGWRTVAHADTGAVRGIWCAEFEGVRHTVTHIGTAIYRLNEDTGELTQLRAGVSSAGGAGFSMRSGDKNRLYVLTGGEYLVYDGETVKDVSETAKVPTVLISRNPSGGGVVFEAVNLLTRKKKVDFLSDGVSAVYTLPDKDIISADKVETMNADGTFSEQAASGYTVQTAAGTVTFRSAPGGSPVAGKDNVRISYTAGDEDGAGYAERVTGCRIAAQYGLGAQNRVFFAGNPEYKAYDRYSDIYDPTYVPDTAYAVVGAGDTAIMGYLRVGEHLAVVKEESGGDATVFLRYGEMEEYDPSWSSDHKREVVFKVRQGIVGTGAVAPGCFANLGDEPLFLARTGVHAITSTLLSYDRTIKNRSRFLDRRLLAEANPERAAACEHDGYYILAINDHCYILDSRGKSGATNGNSDFAYEGYYWSGVPAVCLFSHDGVLWFGTEDGRVCRFNTDAERTDGYVDEGEYVRDEEGRLVYASGGRAIECMWVTPNDDDGMIERFKTLTKKGSLVVLNPYLRSGGSVYFIADANPERFARSGIVDIFDWHEVDFERFSFDSREGPREIYFRRKVKKYKRLQIVIRNDGLREGFGILEIVKSFTTGNYSKNRG